MANILKRLFGFLFDSKSDANEKWWLEVKTAAPACTYYFGPFDSESEAEQRKQGYLDDLHQEGSKVLSTQSITLTSPPDNLTVYEEAMDGQAPDPKPAFSGQS
ncbi:MAG: DUF1816 domain-containing protein [Leptolyngbyaceae cyanobacterium]